MVYQYLIEEERRRRRAALGLPPDDPDTIQPSELIAFLQERVGPVAVPMGTKKKPPRTGIESRDVLPGSAPGPGKPLLPRIEDRPSTAQRIIRPVVEQLAKSVPVQALGLAGKGIEATIIQLSRTLGTSEQDRREGRPEGTTLTKTLDALALGAPPGAMAVGGVSALRRELGTASRWTTQTTKKAAPTLGRLATEEAGAVGKVPKKPLTPSVAPEALGPAAKPAQAAEAAATGWETGASRPFKFDPNSTVNQGRFRLLPPVKGGAYITRQSGTPGVSYIVDTEQNAIQAVRFDKKLMPEAKAAEWWEANAARLGQEAPVGARGRPVSESAEQTAQRPGAAPTDVEAAAQGLPPPAAAAPPRRPPGEPPVITGALPPGESPRPTPEEATAALGRLTQFIHSPESINLSDLTVEMRRKQLGERLGHFQDRTEALLSREGMKFEDAMKQAQEETMSGAFDRPLASLSEVMADQFRDSAFARVYEVLKNEPLERMSTSEALTNALLGKGIPRTPGTAGGSAYTRLSRVFPPEVMAILEKDKPLAQKFEDVLLQSGEKYKFTTPQGPWPPLFEPRSEQLSAGVGQSSRIPVQQTPLTPAEEFGLQTFGMRRPQPITGERPTFGTPGLIGEQGRLRVPGGVSEMPLTQRPSPLSQGDLFDLQAFGMERPQGVSMPRYEAPIEAAIKMPSLMPAKNQHIFVRAAKQLTLTALDVANLLRSNKAGFDFSWWRQQVWLTAGHLGSFYKANIAAWKGMWNKSFAQSVDKSIKEDLFYYQHYEQAGYDFLRPLEQKGVPVWQREETYAVLGGERPIAKFAEMLPWIRLPQRAFVTGTNVMNWDIWRGYVDNVYKMNEKIASGAIKLKPGEAFDVAKSIENHAKMLADMTGRAKLGPLKEMSGAINAGFFSMRLNLGRLLMPRHLLSADPLVRKEAWKNIVLTVASISAVEFAGQKMGLWRVEVDPRSPNVGTMQIGPIRFDPWGGMKKYAVLVARLVTMETKSGKTGQVYPTNIYQIGGRFVAGMESPGASLISEFLTGETFVGEDVDFLSVKQWADRVAPMNLADMYDAVEQSDSRMGFLVGIPSSLGVGVTSYGALEAKYRDILQPYWDIDAQNAQFDAVRLQSYQAGLQKGLSEKEATALAENAAARAATKARVALRAKNPELDAILVITGQVEWVLPTKEAITAVVRLTKENGLSVEDVLPVQKAESPTRIARRKNLALALGVPAVGKPAAVPATQQLRRPTLTPIPQGLSERDKNRAALGLPPLDQPEPVGAR